MYLELTIVCGLIIAIAFYALGYCDGLKIMRGQR